MSERPLSAGERFSQIAGAVTRILLQGAEKLAYDVTGLAVALRRIGRAPDAAWQTEPARYLHQVYGQYYWRSPLAPLKCFVAALLWPPVFALAVAGFTFVNGRAIAKRSGTSVLRQIGQQLAVGARHSIAPYWYYMYELYDDARRASAGLYLTAHETIGPAYSLMQPAAHVDYMADKVWFADYCRRNNVRAVPVYALFSGGAARGDTGLSADLPEEDLFVKLREGSGGHNTERWDYLGNGRYRNSQGEIENRTSLAARLMQDSLKDDYIVQPRLVNHRALADFSNDALATARILTCRNEEGDYEATNAAFRMAIGKNTVKDNFHSGGIATEVDLRTGVIGAATNMGLTPGIGWREVHPVSGAQIAGRQLPNWQAALELACDAHRAFPERVVVGWDVAFLADGPMIVEGNGKPDLDIHQRVERRPAGAGRIAYLLAMNLHRALTKIGAT